VVTTACIALGNAAEVVGAWMGMNVGVMG
jgi:hypothetical protein